MSKRKFRKFLCIDIESGGGSLKYSLLTACFKVVSFDGGKITIHDTLTLVIKHDPYKVSASGMATNKLDFKWLDENGTSIGNAGKQLFAFLEKNSKDGFLVPLGHGIHGDIAQILNEVDKDNRLMSKGAWYQFVSYTCQDTGQIALTLKELGQIPEDQDLGLSDLCGFWSLTGFNFHTCEGDVDASIAVYVKELDVLSQIQVAARPKGRDLSLT